MWGSVYENLIVYGTKERESKIEKEIKEEGVREKKKGGEKERDREREREGEKGRERERE